MENQDSSVDPETGPGSLVGVETPPGTTESDGGGSGSRRQSTEDVLMSTV